MAEKKATDVAQQGQVVIEDAVTKVKPKKAPQG
jgi:hypothetical protein